MSDLFERPPFRVVTFGHINPIPLMRENILSFFSIGKKIALDFLLPPVCLSCFAPTGQAKLLCTQCFAQLSFISEPFCPLCALPLPFSLDPPPTTLLKTETPSNPASPCPSCEQAPPPWAQARAALLYDEAAKKIILPLKYADRTELAPFLANILAMVGKDMLSQYHALVPVPLHKTRLRQRYYNQAALIGHSLSKVTGLPLIVDGLIRNKKTPSLEGLNRQERTIIMTDAIHINPQRQAALLNKKIILIDDIMTTGATLTACCQALAPLTEYKPAILVMARTPPPDIARPYKESLT
ncbi:ComF family protein [Entomobacter blattae]|uniref:Double zinc ribbon domain-containing protein n=1 Tax=Entomobacter blattae TaxID=2762277 RepID=A0A7H1NTN4_9PROT|nr:ComF family protein [Entomobacter blattae]QNT79144.1 hypothetical protein JGUZn3_19310 [Entomobacter blattae]